LRRDSASSAELLAALRNWSITLVTAAVTAAVLVGVAIVLADPWAHQGAEAASQPAQPPAGTPGRAQSSRAAGPEGVPLVSAAPLGPASSPAPGSSRGGIPCGSKEQIAYHVHARLAIFIDGRPRAIPAGVGIAPPLRITKNPGGPFVSSGRCFSFLHTHAADGVIHIEAPGRVIFKLGQFFEVWQERLDSRHLGNATGRVVAYLNGRRYRGDPRAIPLTKHAQIQLELGRPRVAPVSLTFPPGL
jgi:hypothetical protein